VTIEGLKYVIDSGLVKVNYFDVRSGVDSLVCRTISKAAAKQRAGRAGRTQVFSGLFNSSWIFLNNVFYHI
jgi:HrpA-like RNA helicase